MKLPSASTWTEFKQGRRGGSEHRTGTTVVGGAVAPGNATRRDGKFPTREETMRRREEIGMKTWRVVLFALALVVAYSTIVRAESDASALAPVVKFFDDYNRHDITAASALFVEKPSVTDAFPPFYWQGKDAFKQWMADLDKYNAENKYTDYDFKIGKPLSEENQGTRANVVVPVVLDLKHGGKPERFEGLVNVVLMKTHNGWGIAALTFTATAGPAA
jgi:hypothetical protein